MKKGDRQPLMIIVVQPDDNTIHARVHECAKRNGLQLNLLLGKQNGQLGVRYRASSIRAKMITSLLAAGATKVTFTLRDIEDM